MKIGVWLNNDYKPEEGGGYSYYQALIKGLDSYIFKAGIELVFISTSKNTQDTFNKKLIILPWERQLFKRTTRKIAGMIPVIGAFITARIDYSWSVNIRDELHDLGIDILYYPSQMDVILPGFPFICTSWDLGSFNSRPFPELANDESNSNRHFWYHNILPKAPLVFAESEAGKKEIIEFLNIPPENIKVVPLFARMSGLSTATNLNSHPDNKVLSLKRFFFYPAQFWPHKNHMNLLMAFSWLCKNNPGLNLVFTGSDKGHLGVVRKEIERLELNDNVHILGFVDQVVIDSLYHEAVALVMPTFLGPTNIPLLEALLTGCPVICSDFEGHREMLENTALYFDPATPETIYDSMQLILKPEIRESLLRNQAELRKRSIFTLDHALKQIEKAFLEL